MLNLQPFFSFLSYEIGGDAVRAIKIDDEEETLQPSQSPVALDQQRKRRRKQTCVDRHIPRPRDATSVTTLKAL